MFSQNEIEKIKKIIEEFFKKTTFEVEIEVLPPQDLTLPINIKTEDPQILIGEQGQTLLEIQHLLKTILKRNLKNFSADKLKEENFYIDLDINNYKKKKIEYLRELARSVADEVSLSKKEKELVPMPAYERRVIHLELASRNDVTTESIGQEPERRVVIKPYP